MNTVEDLLREGMERFTRDLRAPAGLARRVARRRRRRLALRSAAAAAAAAALTAGIVTLTAVAVPGADATADVVKRVDRALTAAEPGAIAQATVTTRSMMPDGTTETTTAEEWSYGNQWRSVASSPTGRPVYDEGSSASSVYTLVSYPARTWARQREQGPAALSATGPGSCGPVVAALPLLFQPGLSVLYQTAQPGLGFSARSQPATVARALRAAISCGALTVVGRQRVDGIEAIELTSRPGLPASETIWVSPGTYLPLRVVIRSAGPHHDLVVGPQEILQLTADITWLRPTAQNLARLTVPIPAGFRHVTLAQAVVPILPLILGGPKGVARAGLPGPALYDKPAGRCKCSPRPTAPWPSG